MGSPGAWKCCRSRTKSRGELSGCVTLGMCWITSEMAKVIMIIIVTVKIIIMISRIAGEADQQILITINKKNNNNGDKQNDN